MRRGAGGPCALLAAADRGPCRSAVRARDPAAGRAGSAATAATGGAWRPRTTPPLRLPPQDHHPTAWWTEDGKRLGNYIGHNGAVSTCDVSRAWRGGRARREARPRAPRPPTRSPFPSVDTRLLLTGSADSSAKLWDVKTGACLHTWQYDAPCKAVAFALGDSMCATSTDPFLSTEPAIRIYRLNTDEPGAGQDSEPTVTLTGFKGRTNRVVFHDANKTLLSAGEDGCVRRWCVATGELLQEAKIHDGPISDLHLSPDGTHFATASLDTKAKLVDALNFEVLKTYPTGTNANAVALSPIFHHVLVGGGQEASQVTTTSARAGKFESRFFHRVFCDEVGTVRGHFGPINAVAFSPDGRAFATGGEDGYVRLHHFDSDYFKLGAKEQ